MALAGRSVAVVGGAGCLGLAGASFLKAMGCQVSSIDIRDSPIGRSMRLSSTGDWKRQADDLAAALRQYHKDGLDMVFCAAGGWQGGGMKDKGVLASAEAMWEVNARTALVSAHVASSMLNDDGMLVLTGAQAALQPTPGMIGYGMAKVATAHLCASIAADPAIKWRCSAILPNIIDTPANQDAMGHYIHDDWTPPEKIAEKLVEWLREPAQRPPRHVSAKIWF